MKACIFQPPYSRDVSYSDEYFEYKMKLLDDCDDSMDIIVLPEYSDVPCATSTLEETLYYHNRYIDRLLTKCVSTAKRCNAMVFVNALSLEETGYRNTTYAYNRQGELVGKYFKRHLPPLEMEVLKLDSDYTFNFSEPYTIEIDGLRFGFLTCYDFYFYEAFANIARENVDIIIGCSLQRSDSHDAIETMCRFLAYNTNSYVIRSSVSFDPDSNICGAGMIVTPTGKVLANMKGEFGMCTAEFDPKDKYFKPAGYGNPDAAHYEYIEYGRKPMAYRNSGPSIVTEEEFMPYPRVCVKNGFEDLSQKSLMAALGAAACTDAQEIGIELICKEGSLFCRNTSGGDSITFESLLRKLSGRVIINAYLNDASLITEALSLIKKYDAEKHYYFTVTDDSVLYEMKKQAASARFCLRGTKNKSVAEIIEHALQFNIRKIELSSDLFTKAVAEKIHAKGLRCNIFAEDAKETDALFKEGADTVITNNYEF